MRGLHHRGLGRLLGGGFASAAAAFAGAGSTAAAPAAPARPATATCRTSGGFRMGSSRAGRRHLHMECHHQHQQRAVERQHRERTHRPDHLPRLTPSRLRCGQDEAVLRLHRIAPIERQLPHEGMVGIRASPRHHHRTGIRQSQQHHHPAYPRQSPHLRLPSRKHHHSRDDS